MRTVAIGETSKIHNLRTDRMDRERERVKGTFGLFRLVSPSLGVDGPKPWAQKLMGLIPFLTESVL